MTKTIKELTEQAQAKVSSFLNSVADDSELIQLGSQFRGLASFNYEQTEDGYRWAFNGSSYTTGTFSELVTALREEMFELLVADELDNATVQAINNAGTLEELANVGKCYGFSLCGVAVDLTGFTYYGFDDLDASNSDDDNLIVILEGNKTDYIWETGSVYGHDFYTSGTVEGLETAAIEWLEDVELSTVKQALVSEYL